MRRVKGSGIVPGLVVVALAVALSVIASPRAASRALAAGPDAVAGAAANRAVPSPRVVASPQVVPTPLAVPLSVAPSEPPSEGPESSAEPGGEQGTEPGEGPEPSEPPTVEGPDGPEYVADSPSVTHSGGFCDPDDPVCNSGEPGIGEPQGGNEGEEVGARDDWFLAQRAYPFANVPSGALARSFAQAAAVPLVRTARVSKDASVATNTVGAWTSIGPRPIQSSPVINNVYNGKPPYTGRVTAIAPHPTIANTVYIGTAFGGVWKTVDAGAHWTPIFDNGGSLSIGAVAVSKSNPAIIYVGTGEANSSADSYFGNGVYKSRNGGGSWTRVGGAIFNGCGISRIVIDATHPGIVLVASKAGSAGLQGPSQCAAPGLYRTSNGSTFSAALTGPSATDVVEGATAPNTMYAAFSGGYLYKSTNAGAPGSWNQIINGPPTYTASTPVDRTVLSVSPNGKVLYVAQADYPSGDLYQHRIWKTTNGGGSWSHLTATSDFCSIVFGQCWYDLALAVNPANTGQLFAAGIYLNRCAASCSTIVAGVNGIHVDFHALAFDASGRLWAGSDGGVYRSSNGGNSFSNLNATLALTQFYPGITGTPAGVLMGGVQDNGSLRYTPASKWHEIASGDGGYTAIDPANSNIEYETYPGGWVYQSLNGGSTEFGAIDSYNGGTRNVCGLKSNDYCQFIFPMVMDPTNHHRLYVGSRYLWRGTGSGSGNPWKWTWKALNTAPFNTAAQVVAPAPSSASVIYVATSGSVSQSISPQFLVSRDGGRTFTARNGLPNRFISDIYVDPANAARAWVALSGFGAGHVFRTVDFGQHWSNETGNLPDTPVGSIVVDTRPAIPVLYVGTDAGVFRSINSGGAWSRFGSGLPHSVVMDLVLDRTHNTLTAATHGRGVFVTGLP